MFKTNPQPNGWYRNLGLASTAGKGVHTATDSALGGATMTDSAKTGGDAALKEAMGTTTPAESAK